MQHNYQKMMSLIHEKRACYESSSKHPADTLPKRALFKAYEKEYKNLHKQGTVLTKTLIFWIYVAKFAT